MINLFSPYHLAYVNVVLVMLLSATLLIYKFVFKKNINLVLLIIIISVLASWSIFRPGTYQSGDLRTHTAQLISFYNNLQQGVLLPRWAGDLCGSYGCPVLEFFYTLPYYIGSVFHYLGFSFLTSIKLVLFLSFGASGLAMYLWLKEEVGKKAGFIGAIFYLFAPYHLIDLHFRAGVGEVLSFVFIPLLFLFTRKIINTAKIKYFILEAITISLLLLSHSSTFTIVVPFVLIYGLITWLQKPKREFKELLMAISGVVFGVLILTVYWLPALVEAKYTWYGVWSVFPFPSITEYLYSTSGFGLLFQGNHGEYRLIVGYFHWIAILLAIILLLTKKIIKEYRLLLSFFVISFFILFFMMLDYSKPLWQLPVLNTFLIVWRLLIPIAFFTSAIAAILAVKLKNNLIFVVLVFLVISTTVLNWGNRKLINPPNFPLKNEVENYTEYVNPVDILRYKKIVSHEKVRDSIVANSEVNKTPLEFVNGKGRYLNIERKETSHKYIIDAYSDLFIKENTYYFPGWKVYIDGKQTRVNVNNEYGIITFSVRKGLHQVNVVFENSPIRQLAQNVSLSSLFLFIIFIILLRKKKILKLNKMNLSEITTSYRSKLISISYRNWIKKADRVLDVGCGTAIVSSILKQEFNLSLVGCDIDKYTLRSIPFKKMVKENKLPFKDNSFDLAMLNDVLHHTSKENQIDLIKESLRVSKKVLIFEVKPTFYALLFDFILNKIHNPKMNIPLTFRTEQNWEEVFKKIGCKYNSKSVNRPFFYPFNHVAFELKFK